MNYYSILRGRRFFTQLIKKEFVPSCSNCIYNITYLVIDEKKQNVFYNGCKLYPYRNILNGQSMYDCVLCCRIDERKCGQTGKHFKPSNR